MHNYVMAWDGKGWNCANAVFQPRLVTCTDSVFTSHLRGDA